MMELGSIGARDRDGTPRSVLDWRRCSNSNGGAVPPVGCSSTMRIGLRLIISMAIAVMHAGQTSKRCMDTATMRRRGSIGTLSRTVCVTSIRTLRSGVLGNGHAPFWNSGRRSAPPLDCNKLSDRGKCTTLTPRRRPTRSSWGCDTPPALRLVFHITPIRGVLARKKGLELRLNLLLKDRTLLVRLHGFERLP